MSITGAVDKVRIGFPVSTILQQLELSRVGIGRGTLLKSGISKTYDVTIPISISTGIRNPGNPSTSFTATTPTRDSSGTVIDGSSTTNVYSVRQIGTSDITTEKLANNAVTGNKIKGLDSLLLHEPMRTPNRVISFTLSDNI